MSLWETGLALIDNVTIALLCCALVTVLATVIGIFRTNYNALKEDLKCHQQILREQSAVRPEPVPAPAAPPAPQPCPIPLSLLTPFLWQADRARALYVRELLSQTQFRELLAVIQGTAIVPPLSGFDARYELGKVHGLQLSVRLILQMSHPEGDAPSPPRADYGAEAQALRAGAIKEPLRDDDTVLEDGWQPIPPEENLEP